MNQAANKGQTTKHKDIQRMNKSISVTSWGKRKVSKANKSEKRIAFSLDGIFLPKSQNVYELEPRRKKNHI